MLYESRNVFQMCGNQFWDLFAIVVVVVVVVVVVIIPEEGQLQLEFLLLIVVMKGMRPYKGIVSHN